MSKKPSKHTPYFEFVDAQAMAGCPVCRMVYRATDRYLDSLLFEATLDPTVREKLKYSHGFCAEHVEMMRRKPGRALGVALIYRDILRMVTVALDGATLNKPTLARRLRKSGPNAELIDAITRDKPCSACAIKEKTTRDYLDLLVAWIDDETLHAAYSAGDGLCLEHLVGALERVTSEEKLRLLLEPQVARYKVMMTDLDEYIRKRDHRFRGEKMGPEGDVWLRVMNTIIGGAGMGTTAKHGGRQATNIGSRR